MRSLFLLLLPFLLPFLPKEEGSYKPVITKFSTSKKEIALTFDACESKKVMHFDQGLLKFIVDHKVPATIFLTGNFVKSNTAAIRELSKYPFISFGNHSMHHYNHMDRLQDKAFISEVLSAQKLITEATGKAPKYFRFPAGNYSQRDLQIVDSLGLEVVHWTYPSGDPDKNITSQMLVRDALYRVHPGQILIYHINGRGVGTDAALPEIYEKMSADAYRFVSLTEALH